MFENLELTCHLTSFHDEFIVAPSGWKPPDADAASVCRESTQILQDRETFSQSMQAPLTLKVKPMLISTYTFDTNIHWNKIAIYSVRFDVKSTWFDSLLRHFALFHSTAYPRWWVAFPDGECLNYNVPETTSVAYRYRKSISIIELFVSIYIDIYRVLSNYFLAIFIEIYRVGDNRRTVNTRTTPQISEQLGTESAY